MRYKIDGWLMSGNDKIATIKDGILESMDVSRLPFYLQRCNDLYGWLARRAIDRHRTNSRLIKRLARITAAEDPDVAMCVYGATITDNFWVLPVDRELSYQQVRFRANPYADTALYGSLVPFSDGSWQKQMVSPELTNIGSFEKCWKKDDGAWWLYKRGDEDAMFAELFMFKIAQEFNYPVAHYELLGDYVRSKDITSDARLNLDLAYGLVGEDSENYALNHMVFSKYSPEIAEAYVNMLYLDALCRNVDRHTENYGLLRNAETGEVVSIAPFFDHNIALFCRDAGPISQDMRSDLLMYDFYHFVNDCEISFEQPLVSEKRLRSIIGEIPIAYDAEQVVGFILARQKELQRNLCHCKGYRSRLCDKKDYSPLTSQIEFAENYEPGSFAPSSIAAAKEEFNAHKRR